MYFLPLNTTQLLFLWRKMWVNYNSVTHNSVHGGHHANSRKVHEYEILISPLLIINELQYCCTNLLVIDRRRHRPFQLLFCCFILYFPWYLHHHRLVFAQKYIALWKSQFLSRENHNFCFCHGLIKCCFIDECFVWLLVCCLMSSCNDSILWGASVTER